MKLQTTEKIPPSSKQILKYFLKNISGQESTERLIALFITDINNKGRAQTQFVIFLGGRNMKYAPHCIGQPTMLNNIKNYIFWCLKE